MVTRETKAVLEKLAVILRTRGIDEGYVGPNERERIWPRHIAEAVALGQVADLPNGQTPVMDVGTGAGLPGLVLACMGADVTLVDSQRKRLTFVEDVAEELGVACRTIHGRAEDVGRTGEREAYGIVVARALAPPPVALELCLPFVSPGGRFLMLGTPAADPDPASVEGPPPATTSGPSPSPATEKASELLGGGPVSWEPLAVPGVDEARWVMIVGKIRATPDRYPRRAGIPSRSPLG